MPWCPDCKKAYEEGFTRCPGCGRDLTRASPAEGGADGAVLLTSTESAIATQMLTARLRSAGIPFMLKPHVGEYGITTITGPSVFGDEVYVPAGLRKKALVAAGLEGEPLEEEPEPGGEPADEKPRVNGYFERWNKRYLRRRTVVFIILLLALIGFYAFDALLAFLRRLMGY